MYLQARMEAPTWSCSVWAVRWPMRIHSRMRLLQLQVGTNTPRNETLAAFLIARGASALLEYPIEGTYGTAAAFGFPALLAADFGEPSGDALEAHPGVFRRAWSKATIELDCRDLSSSFAFH